MKKIIILIFFLGTFFFSCGDNKFYFVSITNSSSKPVSYIYNDISDALSISETKIYKVEAYTQPPENIIDQNGIASLRTEQDNMTGDYTFFDAAPLDLNVINRLPIDITIKAGNFIDNNGSIELTVGSNDESADAKIYTKSPKFTSTTNYPIIIQYTIVENKISVVIR